MKLMPQELEVWYLIPAMRREISKILIEDFNLNQKQVSDILGITESAVSQYLNSKRAYELEFSSAEMSKIKKFVYKIVYDKDNMIKHLFNLSMELRGTESLCNLHRKYDQDIPQNCDICASHDNCEVFLKKTV